ncbi:low temperature requirement protein A [Solwaraspora sp. WMMB335]|uniref:low temperature requirement protein A n=1 Tax=Solwaraspora sp. WMMB335 TaxID=3404118 RepID=UPI003B9536B3
MSGEEAVTRVRPAAPGAKVTRLELFYDLVFVFAFIHLNTTSAKHLDAFSLLAIFLLLGALWLVWSRFAVLGNNIRADQGVMPIVGFAIMTAIFVSVASLPEFGGPPERRAAGVPLAIPGELIFPACYALIWLLEILALRHAAKGYPWLRKLWWRSAPALALSTVLLVVAAFLPPQVGGNAGIITFIALWAVAIATAYLAAIRTDALAVVSAGHWTERHAQIILIALGESVISLGIGANLLSGTPLTVPLLAATLLGIALICALWWTYFDARSYGAEQVLHHTQGIDRARLARDAYTLLHFPMVFGVVLLSLGIKQVLDHLASLAGNEDPDAVLNPIHLRVLYAGVLLYLLALLAFQARVSRNVDWLAALPILLIGAILPVADRLSPFTALAVLSVITVGTVALETVRYRGARRQLRSQQLAEQQALESEETDWRRRHL